MRSLFDSGSRHAKIQPILILSTAVILAVGGLWGYYSLREGRPVLDPETLCPRGGPSSRTVLLLDVSDPLGTRQRAALDTLLSDLRNPLTSEAEMSAAGLPGGVRYVEPYAQLVAYSLDVEESELEPFLRICNPGNPEEMTIEGKLTTSKRRMAARWDNFEERIQEAFAGETGSEGLPNSPLLEALAFIVQREASSTALRATGNHTPLRVIIFSDMVQHSQALSHFRELPDWDVFERSPQYATLRSELSAIEVVIYYLQSQQYGRVQSPEHFIWWREAIVRMNGRLIYIEPI